LDVQGGGVEWGQPLGGAGEKAGIQGAFVQGQQLLVWLETDAYGYRSAYAAVSGQSESYAESVNLQWSAPQRLEVYEGHLSQLRIVANTERAQIFWSNLGNSPHGRLQTVGYQSGSFSAPETLHDTGANTPSASFGLGGRLHVMWRAMHNYYREYHPDDGWRSASRVFCVTPTLGFCYEGGLEQAIQVVGARGVAAWRERIQRRSVAAMALSWQGP
jgi:hypothetical protein